MVIIFEIRKIYNMLVVTILICFIFLGYNVYKLLEYKKTINKSIIDITEHSESLSELTDELDARGYEHYLEDGRLMIKIRGVWNTFYYEGYLGKDITEEIEKKGSIYNNN